MTEAERTRWNRARSFAERQRCDSAAACDYADWCVNAVRSGLVILPAAHRAIFAEWYELANAAGCGS